MFLVDIEQKNRLGSLRSLLRKEAVQRLDSVKFLRFCLFKRISAHLPDQHSMREFVKTIIAASPSLNSSNQLQDKYFSDTQMDDIMQTCSKDELVFMFPQTWQWFQMYSFSCLGCGAVDNLPDYMNHTKKVVADALSWWTIFHLPTENKLMDNQKAWCVPETMMASSQYLHKLSVVCTIFTIFMTTFHIEPSFRTEDREELHRMMDEVVLPGIATEEYMWDSTFFPRIAGVLGTSAIPFSEEEWIAGGESSEIVSCRKEIRRMVVSCMLYGSSGGACQYHHEDDIYMKMYNVFSLDMGLHSWFDKEMQVYGQVYSKLTSFL